MELTEQDLEFPLPEFLALTPERIAANERDQQAWKEAAGFDAASARRLRARIIAENALLSIDQILHRKQGADTPEKRAVLRQSLFRELSRLAEAVAEQGHFDRAASIETDPRRSSEYLSIATAVDRDDDERCECPPNRNPVTQESVPVFLRSRNVYSTKHNAEMPLMKCGICGFMNVCPLPPDAAEYEARQERGQG